MGLDISLLGPPVITVDGAPLEVDTRKATAVLAYVACAPGPVARSRIAAMLWPEADPERSRAVLRRTLSALRTGLGGGSQLITSRHDVSVAWSEDVGVDVAEFNRLTAEAGIEDLLAAVGLYRGSFMEGFNVRDSPAFDDWMMATAAEYERASVRAFAQLANLLREHGRIDEAIDATARWLELDQLHEPAYRTMMQLEATSGDRVGAVKTFRRCVRVLRDELGVAPLPDTIQLYRHIVEGATDGAQSLAEPLPRRRPLTTPIVGRGHDLAAARAALDRSRTEPQALVLTGEAGIGKTRLIDELIATAGDRTSIVAAAHPVGRPIAFGLAAEAVGQAIQAPGAVRRLGELSVRWLAEAARLVPTITDMGIDLPEAPPVDGPGGHQRLIEGVARTLLAAVDEPGILVFEDLQWADDASLEMLSLVMSIAEGRLIVLSYREGEIPAGHSLSEAVREARRKGSAAVIHLERLDKDDVAVLLEATEPDLDGPIDEVYAVTEGVPFFVVEYLAASSGGTLPHAIPQGVRDLLAGRLAALDGLSRQLVDAASVIGARYAFDTLVAVSGRSEEEVLSGTDRLLASGLVTEPAEGRFELAHNLVQQYAYGDINGARRRLLHGRMADHLVTTYPEPSERSLAAGHLEAAGRTREAAVAHAEAARTAVGLYANLEALEHFESALMLGYGNEAELRVAMADAAMRLGDYARALENLETAAAVAASEHMAEVERKLAGIHTALGEWGLAEAGYKAALAAAGDAPLERSRTLVAWAWMAHRRDDPSLALQLARQALEAATLSDDALALAETHNVLGVIERPIDADSARRHHEASLELVGTERSALRAGALNNLAVTHLAIGEAGAGLALAREAIEICSTMGDRHREAAARSNLADLLRATGRSEEALEELKASAALFASVGTGDEAFHPEIWKLTEW